jgi:hypothetical protein
VLVRFLRLALSGLKMFAARYGVVLLTYAFLWLLLRLFVKSTLLISDTGWFDTIFFASLALAATIVWTAYALALRLWRAVEAARRGRGIASAAEYPVLYGIAFVACAVAHQLIDGLRPCIDHLAEMPGSFLLCILTRDSFLVYDPDRAAQFKSWPSDDLAHYFPLAILALVIIGVRFVYRSWKRA